ncbi:uncharacterized protein LOC123923975 [Trifolium pratense]|uniref:uncharacterized protein LOC123923975 n=1 Tax=Trifolium pratense TaxID=57577 RepID=UPI001E697303|nr:uncharacterized protein LOC123923975 [Trifolium pratense]
MDKKWGASVVVLVLLSFSSIIIFVGNANGASNTVDDGGEQSKKSAMWVWQRLRSAYSMYYSSIFPTTIGQYWHMVKTIVNHTYAYFFPPNIDFRRGDEAELAVASNNGAGEKVKEAFSKSLGTSKATLEDAAKSAAEKVKRTLSDKEEKKRPKEL